MWTDNCIKCFVDGNLYNHPRGCCGSQLGPLANKYRQERMAGKIGLPMCYSCAMPQDLCWRWRDPVTGERVNTIQQCPCAYPHVLLDTWACLWEHSPAARAIWLERICEESGGQ
ncbi:hypothetical protein K504DRAFT_284169 [Pleomassaria siparia CBS 279.74]|uniref:Uncharacterized protein n=1 Tax=Pleomassaria siparia CBS 279.74 TaxID=1314801 RepID=A0A6G1JQD2_9PLEO|nr:hypothetical protein K504DRAFT_284169 [Pleomassaria siparia CBS 279.74]